MRTAEKSRRKKGSDGERTNPTAAEGKKNKLAEESGASLVVADGVLSSAGCVAVMKKLYQCCIIWTR